jgi:hypothetical protein
MKSLIEFLPGEFYALGTGHVLVTSKQAPGNYELGSQFQLESMFDMWELKRDGQAVGFFLHSGFTVKNACGYLVTYMESKKGKAKTCNLVIRHSDVMVYDYEGCGALAVSTKVNSKMLSILLEQ